MAAQHKQYCTGEMNARKGASNLFSLYFVYDFDLLFESEANETKKNALLDGINNE